ncbi:MAG: peptide-methionine (S)-S-oxide reductase [Deltaproteobacteria bacterium]|nr:MAG: peptide-methionine (S)-S-oxide reductase [Deltaproteobacteria bacterium]
MGCYWEGEAALGALEGVVATRAGFLDGEESVELSFDPRVISYPELVKRAAALKCATRVFARSEAQLGAARRLVGGRAVRSDETARAARRSDQEFYLGRSTLRFLPLTPLQATRVNASLGSGGDPARWLSPRQRTLAGEIDAAFRRDPGRVARLERPASIAALPAYERDLRAALARGVRAGG